MRALSAKTKRILQAAGLWDFPCIFCGRRGATTAEHALYFAGRQVDKPGAIIPLCFDCNANARGESKRKSAMCALWIWRRIDGNTDAGLDAQYHWPKYKWDADFVGEQAAARLSRWLDALRGAM